MDLRIGPPRRDRDARRGQTRARRGAPPRRSRALLETIQAIARSGAPCLNRNATWASIRHISSRRRFDMLRAPTVPLLCLVLACHSTPPPAPQENPDRLPAGVRASVLQHHNNATRDGVYVDAALTRAAARGLRQDLLFSATYQGPIDAQPLYWDGGEGGQDLLLVFTERNEVIALDPVSGRTIWSRVVDPPVPRSTLPCGIIDPVGITGTPIIDTAIHLVAMTNGGGAVRHKLYTLSIKDGSDVRPGVDIAASVPGFNSRVQNERGALAASGGRVFIPFAGHVGDCDDYRGWVIGLDPSGAQPPQAFQTQARGGGIWGMTGVVVADGFLFAV